MTGSTIGNARRRLASRETVESGGVCPAGGGADIATANRNGPTGPDAGIAMLRQLWNAAKLPGQELPYFEEVAIGHLGGLAEHVALVSTEGPNGLTFLRAGHRFEAWLEQPARDLSFEDLPCDCVGSLTDAIRRALESREPVHLTAHGIRDGLVGTYDIAAFPMENRWGPPLVLVYGAEREEKHSLVDAMFRATSEGLVAVAATRNEAGEICDFQIVALNDSAARLMRRNPEELRLQRLLELFPRLGRNGGYKRLVGVLTSGQSEYFELDYTLANGDFMHLGVSASPMGELLTLTLSDIRELKTREASFRLLFDDNPVPMWVFDPETLRFLAVNDAAVAHYGYDRETFQEMTLLDIREEAEHPRVRETVASGADIEGRQRQWRHLRADGTPIDVLSYARSIMYHGRPARLVAVIDVTEQREAEARISHMAHHDALTALPNRVLFRERLEESLSRVQRHEETIAVLCLDLDNFKSVNDTLGHPIGDSLLQVVAQRLKECLRKSDMVGRLGGDEFAILQTALSGPKGAGRLAERIVAALSAPYEIEGHQVVTGVSVGIALAPHDAETPDQLLKNADMALYRAKEDGRGTYRFFEPAMDARVQARRSMELDLRHALDAGQFLLHYQPLVSVAEGRVTGFEALLRWAHPERGLIPPDEFIPLAEEIGAIVPIGEWALRRACADAATWPDHVRVAVNLSPVQFRNRALPRTVRNALAAAGLPARRLELEITESVLLRESEVNLATLHRLREIGVRISMDDFGTGYSSLSYLRSFPFGKIKIDQSFVREIAERGDCMAIVRAVTGLGSSLGISTTAEGVETEEQFALLRDAGCTEVQGYLFSHPQPAGEVHHLLSAIGAVAFVTSSAA